MIRLLKKAMQFVCLALMLVVLMAVVSVADGDMPLLNGVILFISCLLGVNTSAESTPLTVTRVELYNSDNALWAHQDCSITVNTGQTGILYWFDFTVTEQEVK